MTKIDDYFKLQEETFKYFGYVEDWVNIPMVDHRGYHWHIDQDKHGSGEIYYCDDLITQEILDDGEYYSDSIYTQRFLKKWVYRG